MHIFTYKIQKYFKLIKLIIKMRCRHQAITISSKAKKGILKDFTIFPPGGHKVDSKKVDALNKILGEI